jgi:hypothetical protein
MLDCTHSNFSSMLDSLDSVSEIFETESWLQSSRLIGIEVFIPPSAGGFRIHGVNIIVYWSMGV